MEDPNDALHDPDPAADKRRCYTVRRSVALSAYWYDRVRQVATSSNLKQRTYGLGQRRVLQVRTTELRATGFSGASWSLPTEELGLDQATAGQDHYRGERHHRRICDRPRLIGGDLADGAPWRSIGLQVPSVLRSISAPFVGAERWNHRPLVRVEHDGPRHETRAEPA